MGTTVEEAEKMLILKTLEATSNNKTRAAEILGISLKTLHNKLKEYGSAAADAARRRKKLAASRHRQFRPRRVMPFLCRSALVGHAPKTKIVLAITFMVAALVWRFPTSTFRNCCASALPRRVKPRPSLTSNLAYLASERAPDLSSTAWTRPIPQAARRAVAYYLGTDRDLNNFLESVVGNWPIIYDAAIVDADGKAILHTNPDLVGKAVPDRPDFSGRENADFRRAVPHGLQPADRL